MTIADRILKDALELKPSEKARLIDKLIASLDKSGQEIDAVWSKESEDRIDAYDLGKVKAVAIENVLEKYR